MTKDQLLYPLTARSSDVHRTDEITNPRRLCDALDPIPRRIPYTDKAFSSITTIHIIIIIIITVPYQQALTEM